MIRRISDQREIRRGRGWYCIVLSIAVGLLPWTAFGQTPTALVKQPPKKLQPLRGKGEKPPAKRAKGNDDANEGAALRAAADDDWPMGGYDVGNTYHNSAEKTLIPPLVKSWEVKLPTLHPEGVAVTSGIVLAAGYRTTPAKKNVGPAVLNNQVVGLDARNGGKLWEFTLPGSSTGFSMEMTPACAGGLACFGGADDNLYAVDLVTGKLGWKHGEMKNMMYCAVLCANGLLYANSETGLWALDPHTGHEKWREKTKTKVKESAIRSGKLFQPRAGALDAATGTPLWKNDLIAKANQIAATDARVFVASEDRIAALEVEDGKTVWELVPKPGARYDYFILTEDSLFAATRGETATVYRLDAASGKVQAEQAIKQGYAKWVAANGVIYASTYDRNTKQGKIVGLAADTLKNVWSTSGSFNVLSMAVANGGLYVVGVKNNGAETWVCEFGNK